MRKLAINFTDTDRAFSTTEKALIKGLIEEKFNHLVAIDGLNLVIKSLLAIIRPQADRPAGEMPLTVSNSVMNDYVDGLRAWTENAFPGLRVSIVVLPAGI